MFYAYGLVFQSEIPLLEFQQLDTPTTEAQVNIRFGHPPEQLSGGQRAGVLTQVSQGEVLIDVPAVARYYVTEGTSIVIDAYPNADEDSMRLFLLTAALGALFHQRRILTLRASSVATPNGAIVIAGASGIGKSMLAAALNARGYGLLSDDISMIALDEAGTPSVVPGAPTMSLWASALDELGLTPVRRLRPNLEKYAVLAAQFCAKAMPIRAVYTLKVVNRDELTLTPIEGVQALPHLLHYVYNRQLALQTGAISAYWETTGAVAATARIAQISRPVQTSSVDRLVAMVEEDMRK